MLLKAFIASFSILFVSVKANDDYRIVSIEQGDVKGMKYWNGEYYEFFGVPYASVPLGRDKFKAPLPPESWEDVLEATVDNIICPQLFYAGETPEEEFAYGMAECLALNLFVPKVANENNLLPVVVYLHSGAFAIGHGNMAKYNYLGNHDVLIISINYRLGAIGFLCLGTEEVPGNAGMKDQVAALRWINKNIKKFGGDPDQVTVAGFSVGAAMAELLTLSKSTEGLIKQIVLDSGSALSPWAINRNPIETAINIGKKMGYQGSDNIKELTEFYMEASYDDLALRSLHFYLKNGTFGFAPCIENVHENVEPFLTESPRQIFKQGLNQKVSVLVGFSNMEGISRLEKLEEWKEDMNNNFENFLPVDLNFPDDKTKIKVAREVKKYYFGEKTISNATLEEYINYGSDSMFTYSILTTANVHLSISLRPIYLYEFSYVGDLSTKHIYRNIIQGASHRDQTAYILDFFSWTGNQNDMDIRDRMTLMWANFVKYQNPTAYETYLVNYKWPMYTKENGKYLSINKEIEIKERLLEDRFNFWNKIYDKYYTDPVAPKPNMYTSASTKSQQKSSPVVQPSTPQSIESLPTPSPETVSSSAEQQRAKSTLPSSTESPSTAKQTSIPPKQNPTAPSPTVSAKTEQQTTTAKTPSPSAENPTPPSPAASTRSQQQTATPKGTTSSATESPRTKPEPATQPTKQTVPPIKEPSTKQQPQVKQ